MDSFTIGRRELYILPTRIGWYFSLILIALFAIAVKFDNQAAFMMLFILTSIGLVAMLYTHNNVINLQLEAGAARAIFVGDTASFPLTLRNPSNSARSAVWIVCDGFHQLLDMPADSQRELELKLPSVKRGYLTCSPVTLTSRFPIGIFFCWTKRFTPEQRCLVYPRPLDLIGLPEGGESGAERSAKRVSQSRNEDYSGMKAYQEGDRMRDVHWPSLAKSQKLVTIQFDTQVSDAANLSWFALPASLGTEDRLSQLCHWVIEAEKNQLRYQLEMPNHTVQYDQGLAHYTKCLTVLALWGERSDTLTDELPDQSTTTGKAA